MEHQPIQMTQRSNRRVSNPMDKICSKLQMSVKDVDHEGGLSKSIRVKIQKLIQKDDVKKLQAYLDKKVLSYDVQIGIQSMKWNILHFASKTNSHKTLKIILCKTYQQSPQKYSNLVNAQTSEGYTPLMISVINFSHEAFSLLLEMGGSDTQLVDSRKMTAYDLALNYKNQLTIRELMGYESANRKRGYAVNQEKLLESVQDELYQKRSCYRGVFDCFVDCFLCFGRGEDLNGQTGDNFHKNNAQESFLRKSFNNNKLMSLLKANDQIQMDLVPIGNKDIEAKYSIQWKRLSTAINQKSVLFDCFQPFDICQNNLIIANNLIIFQCLSDHTWLIRKIVKQLKKSQSANSVISNSNSSSSNTSQLPTQYSIQIFIQDELKKITVDQFIPFLKERQEPMFLSNSNQMWPLILQKGLAKLYGSYMKLSEISPMTFVENLTGSYTKQYELKDGVTFLKDDNGELIRDKSLMGALQDFSAKGYLILLEGRQGTTLSPKNSPSSFKNYCYTILNFYEKGTKKLILVNCPYVLNSWKEKEKTQLMQLKLIKSHYNSHNQMCVWIDEAQFAHFFKNVIISFTEPNMIRTQMKMRYLLEAQQLQPKTLSQSKKLINVIESITNSAKKIFSAKKIEEKSFQKRQSTTQNFSQVKNQPNEPGSSLSLKSLHAQQNYKLITKLVFVKFIIENSKNSESFSLAIKDNITHKACKINSFKGWLDGGSKDIILDDVNPFCTDLIKIKQKKGEYLCMFQVQFVYFPLIKDTESVGSIADSSKNNQTSKKNLTNQNNKLNYSKQVQKSNRQRTSIDIQKTIRKHELLVVCWSEDNVHLEHIEEEFAVIDCMEGWRKNTIRNWSFLDKKEASSQGDQPLKYVTQKLGQKMIVMTKSTKQIDLSFRLKGDEDFEKTIHEMVHEGKIKQILQEKSSEQTQLNEYIVKIDLVQDCQHGEFKYMVLGFSKEIDYLLNNVEFTFHLVK